MTKKNKSQVFLILYSLVLFVFSAFFQKTDNTLFISLAFLPVAVIIAVNAVSHKSWLFVCFFALSAEMYYALVLCLCVIGAPETSWRIAYNIQEYNDTSLRFIMNSLLLLAFVYLTLLYKKPLKNDMSEMLFCIQTSSLKINAFLFVFACASVYYIPQIFIGGTRNYNVQENIMIMSLFRVCCLLSWILLKCTVGRQRKMLIAECIIASVIIVFFSFYGYRFILFENVIAILILNITRIKRIDLKTWIALIVFFIVFYLILTEIKASITNRSADSILFSHEKNLYYSLNAIIANIGDNTEKTYLSTIRNILPKAITGSTDLNTSSILVKYIDYNLYLQITAQHVGVNMGAYYLTEAYANFHQAGIYIVTLFFGVIIALIEKLRLNNKVRTNFFQCFYYGLTTQVFTIVYYGSSNYVKFLVYYLIFSFIIVTRFKLTGGEKNV